MTHPDHISTGEAARRLYFASSQTFLRWAHRVGFPLVYLSRRQILVSTAAIDARLRQEKEADE